VSSTATAVFDFARSRGMITIAGADGMTEVFVPPTTYVKFPDAAADSGALPAGKTWLALPDRTTSAKRSAQPAGNSGATVRFTVKAEASLGGQDIPVAPQGPGGEQWFSTTEVAGRWYVNISDNSALAFGGACA
jgi:hypothetical protein